MEQSMTAVEAARLIDWLKANGHSAEENQVSSVSSSCSIRAQPQCGHFSGAVFATTISPQSAQ